MLRIDVHIHYYGDHDDCVALLDRLDLKFLNICVAHGHDDAWRAGREAFRRLAEARPGRYAWCTTFDPPDFSAEYAERVIAELEEDFAHGAIACKMWKNIGMEIRTPAGEFLMVDDPLFEPIYAYLARAERPVVMHIGEPLACWQPLDEHNTHYGYYSQHPEWHMYTKPEYPSHQALMEARDHVLAEYPTLQVIGAHLGSLEYDVAEIAKRLDRYPNYAVDTSARSRDLAYQDRETVRAFFERYADRVLFGTDLVIRDSHAAMSDDERAAKLERAEGVFQREFAYYESDALMTLAGREVRGLCLGEKVLAQLYHDNAVRWFPGL